MEYIYGRLLGVAGETQERSEAIVAAGMMTQERHTEGCQY